MSTQKELLEKLTPDIGIIGYKLNSTSDEYEDDNHSLVKSHRYELTVQSGSDQYYKQNIDMIVTKLRRPVGTVLEEGEIIATTTYEIYEEIALWSRKPGVSDYDRVDAKVLEHILARPEKPLTAIEKYSDTELGHVVATIFFMEEGSDRASHADIIVYSDAPGKIKSRRLAEPYNRS